MITQLAHLLIASEIILRPIELQVSQPLTFIRLPYEYILHDLNINRGISTIFRLKIE